MKIRNGFVSNSSTASFIVKFRSTLSDKEVSDIIRKVNDYIDPRWDEDQVVISESIVSMMRKKPGSYPDMETRTYPAYKNHLTKEKDIWRLSQDTTMFNDWYDIDCWPFIRAISECRIEGIDLIEIRKTEEEYSDCNQIEEFDKHPWNWDYPDEKKKGSSIDDRA